MLEHLGCKRVQAVGVDRKPERKVPAVWRGRAQGEGQVAADQWDCGHREELMLICGVG